MAKKSHYGTLIRKTRISLGLTQQEAAKKAKIGQSTFSKLECGSYTLFPAIARKICKVLPLQYVPATLALVEKREGANDESVAA